MVNSDYNEYTNNMYNSDTRSLGSVIDADNNDNHSSSSVHTDISQVYLCNLFETSNTITQSYEKESEQDLTTVGGICGGMNISTHMCCEMEMSNKKLNKSKSTMDFISKLNALKLDDNKSPINKLNELMIYLNKEIEYVLVSKEGEVHSPLFTYEARSDAIIAHGSGSSKKEAKKEAAISFLNKIELINSNNTISSTSLNHLPMRKDLTEQISNDKIELNSVGKLQELCIANRWPLPDYKCSNNNADIQNPYHSVICTLNIYRTKGEGRTKQAAKKQAALVMYDQITNIENDKPDNNCCINKFQTPSKINSKMNTKETIKYCSSDVLERINMFYGNLKLSDKPWIKKLKDIHIETLKNVNAIEFLKHIKDEENFLVEYREILNKSNEVIILVEISLNPMVVHLGTGKTLEEAKESGAYITLIYLKLLLHN